ncbi:hypothetical protein NM208_g2141 [Fusarium decemcellulare]|uniref:Uncharacterized protein n=1 Tax=Fusarium decemcellulare TaxID=57161 RepID=A0ACC1STP4_9HYPO|nr:hypothetical protein NM208_g2141 [Fusarium decemcellulare]
MESIDGSFTIRVDGKNISHPSGGSHEPRIPAQPGSEPAVFNLRNCHLESGDWVLGRFQVEDLSLRPKHVYWFKKDQAHGVQPVFAVPNGSSFDLKFAGASLAIIDDKLYSPLLDEPRQPVEIKMQ